MSRTKPPKPKPKQLSFLHASQPTTTTTNQPCTLPPLRIHALTYHTPLLLHDEESSKNLLTWFDGTAQQRAMPWRKPWTEPQSPTAARSTAHSTPGSTRSTRAYEVWISEIMLQQTRVSTVIPFYKTWLSKWPTVDSLALASQDEVLSVWKGLGYYSRATRLHEAAQQIVSDLDGEIPATVDGLLRIKGIGPYTAGAVSSIAFGRAVPVLDGNVSRVLSRQMGLYARVKDKKVEDVLWDAAALLVERVSGHSGDVESSVPGRWNQGLMELGSTICTPKPKCGECPVQNTCRAYAEGVAFAQSNPAREQSIADIEDACTLCLPLAPEDLPQTKPTNKKRTAEIQPSPHASKRQKQTTLTTFTHPTRTTNPITRTTTKPPQTPEETMVTASTYITLFPPRTIKKTIPTQESLVCIIQRRQKPRSSYNKYLIEQRPETGLLANLWQFPNMPFESTSAAAAAAADEDEDEDDENVLSSPRAEAARKFVGGMLSESGMVAFVPSATRYSLSPAREIGCVVHVFTHLKLRMYVMAFELECGPRIAEGLVKTETKRMWVDGPGVEAATFGAGMQRCWGEFLAG